MLVYNYSPIDFTYIDSEEAFESPLEKGVFLIPANATEIQPPKTKTNEIAVFDIKKQKWLVVADYRGLVYDKQTQEPHEITELGDISEGYTPKAPKSEYDVWNEEKQKWEYSVLKELEAKKLEILSENDRLLADKQENGAFHMKDTPIKFAYKDSKGKTIIKNIEEFYIKIKTPTPPNDVAMATMGFLGLSLENYPQLFRVDNVDGVSGLMVNMSLDEVKKFYQMLVLGNENYAGKYTELDSVYTSYRNAINNANTMQELNEIKLDYSII